MGNVNEEKIEKRIKHIMIFLCLIIGTHFAIGMIWHRIELFNCKELYASEIINIPSNSKSIVGFTCTGLCWNENERLFYVGNAGKKQPTDKEFEAGIAILNENFDSIVDEIKCYQNYSQMRDVQGVCIATDGSIWFCSYGENLVRHIDREGNDIGFIEIKAPSGIAFDNRTDTLWILTDRKLYHVDTLGNVLDTIRLSLRGQDQLCIDCEKDIMYVSVGLNYHGDSYIYAVNLSDKIVKPKYILKDSFAIEGIYFRNDTLYVLNDGFYHNAQIPNNQVNIYKNVP